MEVTQKESQVEGDAPSGALRRPDTAATLRNAVALWAEQNTRHETLAPAEKLHVW